MPSLELGSLAIKDRAYFEKTVSMIVNTRERVKKELRELGFEFADSKTNFVFAKHKEKSGKEIFDYLRANNIIVRRWDAPRIKDHLRISIGTDEEMDILIAKLKEFLG